MNPQHEQTAASAPTWLDLYEYRQRMAPQPTGTRTHIPSSGAVGADIGLHGALVSAYFQILPKIAGCTT